MAAEIANIEKVLSTLKREVDDLHPRLEEFFSKLEAVTHVEYTHGCNEYGADFILTKEHDLTRATIYVGVIVKNGNITQSAVDEIKRQIEECITIKRPIGNGLQRVRLNDVWVIANGNISGNAKEKICEIRGSGIVFTDRKGLATLMVQSDYKFSDDLPTNISICLSKQFSYAEVLKNETVGMGMSGLEGVFMRQGVIKQEPVQYSDGKPKYGRNQKVSIESAIEKSSALVLHGEPGSGKSKMLQNVFAKYAEVKEFEKTKLIPIFVTGQEMLEKYKKSIGILIDKFEEKNKLTSDTNKSSYIVIIDGIDECDLSWDERLDIVKKWTEESVHVRVKKVILASRDHIEEKLQNISIYRIAPLSMREVIRTIKIYLSSLDAVDRIVEDIEHSDIFRSLPQSPLATIILISLLRDEGGNQELPANLTELFVKYSERSLGRWDKDVEEGVKQRRYEAADKILTQIAIYMLDNRLTQINKDEAKGFFVEYLKVRNLGIDADELFNHITNHSNLLYLNDGVFRFRHRTITEFFYSKGFSDSKIEEIGENIFDVHWATILFFYVGLQKDCPLLLQKINGIIPEYEAGKVLKSINMANILLAGYATPYEHIQEIVESIFIDTSQYLDDIFTKKIETTWLSKTSIMHALFVFRLIMDYQYSRPFFKQAIEESMVRIEVLDIEDDLKATSLFLLNLAYASLGGEDIFSSMVEKLGNKIPMHIRLAIKHEADIMKLTGGSIKKFKRITSRSLSGSRAGNPAHILYNRQIRNLPRPKDENQ